MSDKASILIVDDDESIRESLALIVRGKRYRVETAGTGQEALKKAWNKDINVALVDLKLPDMGGMNLIAPLKEMHPELAVIVITGFASIDTAMQALNKGASAYITKPLNMDELCAKVEEVLEKQRLLAENKRLVLELKRELDEHKRAEEALQISETRYRRLFEAAQDGILLLDAETGQITEANPFIIDLLGYSREELLRKKLWEIGAFKDIQASKSAFGELQREEYVHYENLPLETKDGRSIEVEFVSNVYLVNNKGVVQCNIRDITERRVGEKQRELSLQLLEVLNRGGDQRQLICDILMLIKEFSGFEAVGIRIKAGEDFPYYETKGFGEDFVRSESSLCTRDLNGQLLRDEVGNPLLECMCGNIVCGRFDPQKPFFTRGGSFWTNSTPELLASTTEADRQARTRNRCNGEGYESVALIPLKSQGTIVGLLQLNDKRRNRFTQQLIEYYEGIGQSIGILLARKRAEEARIETEERFRALIENSSDIIAVFDANGTVQYESPSLERILGYKPDELIGKNLFELGLVHPDDLHDAVDKFNRCINNPGQPICQEIRFLRKDGSWNVMEGLGNNLLDTPRVNGIIVHYRDITERKRVERERERLLNALAEKTKELEQIVYVTSHDLRSPLVNIQGFTRELEQSCKQVHDILYSKAITPAVREKLTSTLSEDIPSALQYILASSAKMDSLLSGLLQISRLGRAPLDIKKLDMNKLMSEVVSSFEFQVKEADATVKIEELPPCMGDEIQINQVFSNLLGNALKFLAPERSGVIGISGKEEKEQVIYCVEDNGIGIAEKDKNAIFEMFCKLDSADKRGEGLGLTIVRKILERHGGKVWVESEPGKGSRLFVSLPKISGQ